MEELLGEEQKNIGNAILSLICAYTEFVFFRPSWVKDPKNLQREEQILDFASRSDAPIIGKKSIQISSIEVLSTGYITT